MITHLGNYLIEYDNGVKQTKLLISHSWYVNVISPLLSTGNDSDKKAAKKLLGADEYFTDESGLFEARKTGILKLPPHMGGDSKCIVTKIN
jgi:hypothetical protein